MHYQRRRKEERKGLVSPCSEYGCDEPSYRLGRCKQHYAALIEARAKAVLCAVPDCGRPTAARGLCGPHYQQIRRERPGSASVARVAAPKFDAVYYTPAAYAADQRRNERPESYESSPAGKELVALLEAKRDELQAEGASDDRKLDVMRRLAREFKRRYAHTLPDAWSGYSAWSIE